MYVMDDSDDKTYWSITTTKQTTARFDLDPRDEDNDDYTQIVEDTTTATTAIQSQSSISESLLTLNKSMTETATLRSDSWLFYLLCIWLLILSMLSTALVC
ncbi:unnamed protein product [Didymodactylos carnosus]|uniref:Uncharacterized protein n=1 Tax=Didymodactylos carnosus TaxID=1234261 RepID=A0A814E2J3_9BILA|nr:unnamed protein product [Didymodactylos carnosus]CAF1401314.1 unnamed protein product [Didymodactylos carnosus]CAF3737677.1 unnamed protein product [Didymodactylos carnosus]CAF4208563.1 unnamed protein product [Didymodactylos carnosus]